MVEPVSKLAKETLRAEKLRKGRTEKDKPCRDRPDLIFW
jgi:hypothetical protein